MSPKHNPRRKKRKGDFSPADEASALSRAASCRKGQVRMALGAWWEILDEGRSLRCVARRTLKKTHGTPVVGDWVDYEPGRRGASGRIVRIHPRAKVLRRPNVLHPRRAQILAANIDQLMIVACRRFPDYNAGFVDRLLIAAWREGLDALVCLNKMDLEGGVDLQEELEVLEAVGARVVETSALKGEGIERLLACLEGKTTVMAGLSGVGKTSLAQRILEDTSLRVGAVSESTGRGRHTTTSAVLQPLVGRKGALIDLPGQRMFGVFAWDEEGVRKGFPELKDLPLCRMPRCSHRLEEGCSIQAAAEKGLISERRLRAFLRIYDQLGDTPL